MASLYFSHISKANAVALSLIGGVPRTEKSGTKIRGECHLLLIGDPGTYFPVPFM